MYEVNVSYLIPPNIRKETVMCEYLSVFTPDHWAIDL